MTEQQPYEVVRDEDGWQLRRYPAHVVVETTVRGAAFENAANRAFALLAGYIKGQNTRRESIAMTAPVVQSAQKIPMTAPVVQSGGDGAFVVAFVLPAAMREVDAPVPTHPEVTLRTVPEQLVAATRFSGRWTEQSRRTHRDELLGRLSAAGLDVVGEPRFARFDPPFTPWFLRRNEVLVDVAA
ncbi:heme-binding protein [Microbacterium sp. ABRD28]|uniref:SOUL family heme-binding protein n=1 Tax=Microbacterium sp. ABRD28 TaxID=2268461 RepID=UPI000F5559C6|nr:heme-binding protein [Microbacterium sp. ABRD28]AZC14462.1 heme-binding protein [Microbacterium sp. ABRD28]